METALKQKKSQVAVNQPLAITVHFGRFSEFKNVFSEFSNYGALKLHIGLPGLHIYSFLEMAPFGVFDDGG